MGVLQRFERRLEGMVEGTFARVFGGVVQPVEVASALQREGEAHKTIVGPGRVLVPNDYVVELGESDADRLGEYDAPLRRELADMVSEHAQEQGWSFVGPVTVRFERVEELATGVFRVRSGVLAAVPSGPAGAQADEVGGGAQLVLSPTPGGGPGRSRERVVPLRDGVTTIGRGAESDVTLHDSAVSRRHAEIRLADGRAEVVDLESTNGTSVNGRRVDRSALSDGDRIDVGATSMLFRAGLLFPAGTRAGG